MKKYLLLIPLLTITLFPSFYTHALTDDYLTSVDNKYFIESPTERTLFLEYITS